jgi:SAM-dependent methyltransferase
VDSLHFPAVYREHLKGRRLLEVGCGTGRHTAQLLADGNQVRQVHLAKRGAPLPSRPTGDLNTPSPTGCWCGCVGGDAGPCQGPVRRGDGVDPAVRADFMDVTPSTLVAWNGGEPFDSLVCCLVLEHVVDLRPFFQKAADVLSPVGDCFISEIHPSRAAKKVLAHFKDAARRQEVHLTSFAHSEKDFQAAAAEAGECPGRRWLSLARSADGPAGPAGFEIILDLDVLGRAEDLEPLNEQWAKRYDGMAMLKIYHMKKIDSSRSGDDEAPRSRAHQREDGTVSTSS